MAYLDPKNDLTFKKVFGEHKNLCISLLNSLLPLADGDFIESIEYLPIELIPSSPLGKNSIVDVRCIDNRGRQFIVEMQLFWTDSFQARVLFNASKAYVRQLGKGYEYKILQPVYSLNLVNDTFNPDKNRYYHHYKIVNSEYSGEQIKGLEFIFIELPKFVAKNISEKKMTALWLRFLTEISDGTKDVSDELYGNSEIHEALNIIQESAFSREELDWYDKYWDIISTERSIMIDAKTEGLELGKAEGIELGKAEGIKIGIEKGIEKGIEQGIEQGIEKGIEQGIEKGIEKGREEGLAKGKMNEKKEIALKGIAAGFSNEIIASLTNLTIAEIEMLRQQGV